MLATPSCIDTDDAEFYPISHRSKVLQRVCRATLKAETYAMSEAVEDAHRLRAVLASLKFVNFELRSWEHHARQCMRHLWVTDCQSLHDHLKNPTFTAVQDKRLSIDLSALRQLIWADSRDGEPRDELTLDLPDQIRWVDTSRMLADTLTKWMSGELLRDAQRRGYFTFEPTAESSLRKLKRQKEQMREELMIEEVSEPHVNEARACIALAMNDTALKERKDVYCPV